MKGGLHGSSLETVLAPYLEIAGVFAALLISTDGLLVSRAGGAGIELDALAARAAPLVAASLELAGELSVRPRLVALDSEAIGVIVAPLTSELLLVIVGARDILRLIRR